MKLFSRLVCAGIILISPVHLTSLAQQTDYLSNYWLLRSQIVTDKLINDATALAPVNRALLWGRLAVVWWKDDQKRARQWLQKAVEAVESSTGQESADDHRRRLTVARSLLRTIAPLDQKLA